MSRSILILGYRSNEPRGLVHIIIAMPETPWNYSVVCDSPRGDFTYVPHRDQKGTPTCLLCIAQMQTRYFSE